MAKSMDGLIGTALLEAIWSSKEQDILDVITPFVIMGVAKTTIISEQIDLNKVARYIEENCGYANFPEAIVEKVLHRNREQYFKKSYGHYYLQSSLDVEVEQLENRKIECKERIDKISERLSEFLKMHCSKGAYYSKEKAPDILQRFFSKYGIDVEKETMVLKTIDSVRNEEEYYIAQFIIEGKQSGSVEYEYIVSLVRGYFLKTAIYLQQNNNNLRAAHFKDVVFYYDTPFLVRLLGYHSEEEKLAAEKLHEALHKQGGNFAFFPQTYGEILSILNAYKHSLLKGRPYPRLLEGLNARNFKPSDVDILKTTFEKTLQSKYEIYKKAIPPYPTDKEGNVDQSKILPEAEIKNYIIENTKDSYNTESLDPDIRSVVGIYHLRNCKSYDTIENCEAIFVTTNKVFTRILNNFIQKNMSSDGIPLVISDLDLSAIAWIKGNKSDSEIPQTQLLVNAYTAMQPSGEIMGRFLDIIGNLQDSGEIQEEEALVLSVDRFVKNDIIKVSLGDADRITNKTTRQIITRYKNHLVEIERAKLKNEIQDKDKKRLENAAKKEEERALCWKEGFVRVILNGIFILFVGVLGIATLKSIISVSTESLSFDLLLYFISGCISILGLYDMCFRPSGVIREKVQKWGNRCKTRIYEREMKKIREILDVGSSETSEDGESKS